MLSAAPPRTAAQARADRKALDHERAKADRQKARATLRALREAVRAAKAKRKEARKAASARCREARLAAKARVRELREAARQQLAEAVRLEKQAAREACQLERQKVDKGTGGAVRAAAERAQAEARYQRELARIERRAERRREASAREQRQESDEEVERNLPPEFVSLWRRVRRGIKGGERKSRTEAFLQYAEENPDDLLGEQEAEAERQLRQWQRQEAELARRQKGPVRTVRRTALAAIPFLEPARALSQQPATPCRTEGRSADRASRSTRYGCRSACARVAAATSSLERAPPMRLLPAASILLAVALSRCPEGGPPIPEPFPAGQGGAPPASGASGSGGSSTGNAGFGGAPTSAGAGGAPGSEVPLCTLPPAPGPDRALVDFRARHAAALTTLGFGSQVAWLLYRETFGAKTTLVALPPVGGEWTRGRLEQVRTKMGSGFVSAPGDGAGNGFKNPCTPVPPRVAGLGLDAPALP